MRLEPGRFQLFRACQEIQGAHDSPPVFRRVRQQQVDVFGVAQEAVQADRMPTDQDVAHALLVQTLQQPEQGILGSVHRGAGTSPTGS